MATQLDRSYLCDRDDAALVRQTETWYRDRLLACPYRRPSWRPPKQVSVTYTKISVPAVSQGL